MQGLLTPVTLQQISNYLNEGFSPQELYFLYMESISVPEPILQNLPNAIAENCAIRLYEPPANELSQMDNDKDPLLLPQRTPTTIQDSYCRYFFGQSWIDSYKIKPNHKVSAEMARLMKAIRPALKELPLDGYIVNSTPKLRFPKFEANAVVSGHHSSECFDGGAISAGSPQDTVDEYGDKVASRNGDRAAKAATLANLRLKAKNISDQLDAAEKAGQNSAADEAKAKSLAIELDKIQYGLGQLVGTSSPIKSQTFVNDPAVFDVTPEGKIIDSRHFTCFKQVLTALLALDISPTPGSPKALYRVPMDYAKDNSRYLADLSQQSLSVGEVSRSPADPKKQPDKFDPTKQFEQIGACKKADDLTIGVAADGYVKALFSLGYDADDKTATPMDRNRLYTVVRDPVRPIAGDSPLLSVSFHPSGSPYAVQLSSDAAKTTPKSDCANAVAAIKFADADGDTPDSDSSANSLTLNYTPRSLEAMVYYLGQIIRRKYPTVDSGDSAEMSADYLDVTFWNSGDIYAPYEEELFDVKLGVPDRGAIASATTESGSYFIPKLCPDGEREKHVSTGCTAEYPNHASAQILTMLNQLWGLNKTQATAPIVAPVTVINPG